MAWAGHLGAGPPACTRASLSSLSQNRPPALPSSSPAPRGRSTASPWPGAATASLNAPTAATRMTVPSARTASSNATEAAASRRSGAATENPTALTSPTSATVKVGWRSLLGLDQLDLAFSPHTHTHNESGLKVLRGATTAPGTCWFLPQHLGHLLPSGGRRQHCTPRLSKRLDV